MVQRRQVEQRATTQSNSNNMRDSPAELGLGESAFSTSSGSVCAVELPESLLKMFRDLKKFSEKTERIECTCTAVVQRVL
jgi:hypothetical protein